jgi:MFS transporter, DHA3 family, macrolide efflux protein
VLRQRPFLAAFSSQACSDIAEQFVVVALTWIVVRSFGGVSLGLVLAAWALPRGVLLLFGGVVADRTDKRTLGLICGALLGVAASVAAALTGVSSLLPWLALAAGLGVLDALRLPVAMSITPLIVERDQLVDANRWTQAREWASVTAGPALAGLVVAIADPRGALLVAAALYLASCPLLAVLPPLPAERAARQRVLDDLANGLRFVVRDVRLRLLLPLFAVANLFLLGAIGVAIPVFVSTILDAGAQGLGMMSGSFGAGLLVGTLLTTRLPESWRESVSRVFLLFAASDLLLGSVGVSRNLALACVLYAASGLLGGPAATLYRTMLQLIPPAAYLGRVNSIARAASFGLQPASTALVGALSSILSGGTLLVVAGLAAAGTDAVGVVAGAAVDRRSPPLLVRSDTQPAASHPTT